MVGYLPSIRTFRILFVFKHLRAFRGKKAGQSRQQGDKRGAWAFVLALWITVIFVLAMSWPYIPDQGVRIVALIAADGMLFFRNESKEIVIIEANPEKCVQVGQCKVSTDGVVWSQLAIVGSRIYVKDKNNLAAYDLSQ